MRAAPAADLRVRVRVRVSVRVSVRVRVRVRVRVGSGRHRATVVAAAPRVLDGRNDGEAVLLRVDARL